MWVSGLALANKHQRGGRGFTPVNNIFDVLALHIFYWGKVAHVTVKNKIKSTSGMLNFPGDFWVEEFSYHGWQKTRENKKLPFNVSFPVLLFLKWRF